MKNNYFKLISLLTCMLTVAILNTSIFDIITLTNANYLLFWIIAFLCSILLVGFEKDKNLNKIDIMQTCFIYAVTYLIFKYVLGIFIGFTQNPYKLIKLATFKVIIIHSFIIVFQELTRYVIIKKIKEKKLLLIFLTLIYTSIDIIIGFKYYNVADFEGLFEIVGLLIIPNIATNILLTYIAVKTSYKQTITYQLILNITFYIIPVYPVLGLYIESIINFLLPTVLLIKLNNFYLRDFHKHTKRSKSKILYISTLIFLFVLVVLNSGIFKVYTIAVGSGSMSPSINKGDIVIIEKLSKSELMNLQVGDIIIYEYNSKLIIHRAIAIDYEKQLFQTKGDYNSEKDDYLVDAQQIKGKIHFKIPIIGFPSVWLSEVID